MRKERNLIRRAGVGRHPGIVALLLDTGLRRYDKEGECLEMNVDSFGQKPASIFMSTVRLDRRLGNDGKPGLLLLKNVLDSSGPKPARQLILFFLLIAIYPNIKHIKAKQLGDLLYFFINQL